MRKCPAATVLKQYVAGELPRPQTELVEAHLGACTPCAERLEQLGGEAAFVDQIRDAEVARAELSSDLLTLSMLQNWFTTTLASFSEKSGPGAEQD